MKIGDCSNCCNPIPAGQMPLVTRWRIVQWGNGMKVQVPDEMFCKACKHLAPESGGSRKYRRRLREEPVEVKQNPLSIKEIAIKLFGSMKKGESYTAKQLAEAAQIEFTPIITKILEKLKEKGKLSFNNGLWAK